MNHRMKTKGSSQHVVREGRRPWLLQIAAQGGVYTMTERSGEATEVRVQMRHGGLVRTFLVERINHEWCPTHEVMKNKTLRRIE